MHSTFLIDSILTAHEINILAGPSSAGKSTLAYQVLSSLSVGAPIWGHTARLVPNHYVLALDRPEIAFQGKLAAMGLQEEIKGKSLFRHLRALQANPARVVDFMPSDVDLLVLDGFELMFKDIKNSASVSAMLSDLYYAIEQTHASSWFITHSPKAQKGGGYANSRDRTFGSIGFQASTSTIWSLSLEEEQGVDGEASPYRFLEITSPITGKETITLKWADNRFERVSRDAAEFIVIYLQENAPSRHTDLVEAAKRLKLASESTIKRQLAKMTNEGTIRVTEKGLYSL